MLAENAASIRQLSRRVIGDVIEIGRRLSDCKRIQEHGKWLPWLEHEFSWSERTARNFMSAYEFSRSSEMRKLVLRLSSLLWRLRRATTIETGLFEIQADHLRDFRQNHHAAPPSREVLYALFRRGYAVGQERAPQSPSLDNGSEDLSGSRPQFAEFAVNPSADLARCFLRLSNLPSYLLDRLSRYEVTLWRQVDQILAALDILDRRKPQERRRLLLGQRQETQV